MPALIRILLRTLLALPLSASWAATYEIPEVLLFSISDTESVSNNPTAPSVFTLGAPQTIARIRTYHWNNEQGATPGTIWLLDPEGNPAYGPWQATGDLGQGGVPDAYWDARPGIVIAAGTYTITDSDPSTWAHNAGTGGRGMCWVYSGGTITVPDPPPIGQPSGPDLLIGSLAWCLDGDPRTDAAVWLPAAPAQTIETTLEINVGALPEGPHVLAIAGAFAADGDPASIGMIHPLAFHKKGPACDVAEIRYHIDADPRTGAQVHAVAAPAATVEETLEISTDSLAPGAHSLGIMAVDSAGRSGIPLPGLLAVKPPAPQFAGFRAHVLDGSGAFAAGMVDSPVSGSPDGYDGPFDWPSFRVRFSGDYSIAIAPVDADGIPGRYAVASFTQVIPPYAAAIYADFWPPEDYPAGALDFDGDANGDGISNGLAFALGFTLGDTRAFQRLPAARGGAGTFTLSYSQRIGGTGGPGEGYSVDGVAYYIETATSPGGPWTHDPALIALAAPRHDNGDGTETVTISVAFPPEQTTAFARLSVEED
jgi:hypothetical protein